MTIADLQDKTFQAAVAEPSRPALVVFFSEWCTTCAEMMPIVEELAGEYRGRLNVYRIDFDENLDSVVNNGVMVVPTTFVFKNGQPLERMAGLQERKTLVERIERHL